jgi:hypothetical protein
VNPEGDESGADGLGDEPHPDELELLAAFDRLSPQGGHRWAFDDAMRRIVQPSDWPSTASVPWGGLPDDLWERGRSARIGGRFVGDVAGVLASILASDARQAADAVETANADRLTAVWDALRYLAARVELLESRVDPAGRFLTDPANEASKCDLSAWMDNTEAWLPSSGGTEEIVVGESGNGELCAVLEQRGFRVRGIEPRGDVVWRSSAHGASDGGEVVLGEVPDVLGSTNVDSVDGVVLVGCVDRFDLSGKLDLVGKAMRAVRTGGTVALAVTDRAAWEEALPVVARDLAPGRPLHPETWMHVLRVLDLVDPTWHRPRVGPTHIVVGTVR